MMFAVSISQAPQSMGISVIRKQAPVMRSQRNTPPLKASRISKDSNLLPNGSGNSSVNHWRSGTKARIHPNQEGGGSTSIINVAARRLRKKSGRIQRAV